MAVDFPKISIITPSYNQAAYLRETIESVLAQDYPSVEYIVVDDGSSDESFEIIESYGDKISASICQANHGQSHAINRGFANSSGSILTWLNSDDVLAPGALAHVAACFLEHPSAEWLIGSSRLFGGRFDPEVIRETEAVNETTLMSWMEDQWFPQQSTFWRRGLWERCGPLNETLHYLMDWNLWLQFYSVASKPLLTPRTLSGYRFHDQAKCTNKESLWSEEPRIHEWIAASTVGNPMFIYRDASAKRMERRRRQSSNHA